MAHARKQKRVYALFMALSILLAIFALDSRREARANAKVAEDNAAAARMNEARIKSSYEQLERALVAANASRDSANAARLIATVRERQAMIEAERADDFKRIISDVRMRDAAIVCVALRETAAAEAVSANAVTRILTAIERQIGRPLQCPVTSVTGTAP
jgi:hypothetical protein